VLRNFITVQGEKKIKNKKKHFIHLLQTNNVENFSQDEMDIRCFKML